MSRVRWCRAAVAAALLAVLALGAAADGAADAALREAVFEAAALGDETRLAALADAHLDAIRAGFGGWMRHRASLEGAARIRAEKGLEALAALFEQRGDRTLRGMLSGAAGNQRARGWGRVLHAATERARAGDCEGAVELLEPVVEETAAWEGDVVDVVAMGAGDVLGACHLEAGAYDRALAATYAAYERAAARGDRRAIAAFGRRMAEAHAGAGESAQAREWASATARVLRNDGHVAEAEALERAHGAANAP